MDQGHLPGGAVGWPRKEFQIPRLENAVPSFSLDNGRSAGVNKSPRFCYADIAEVAELVDALGSGSSGCTPVRVQVPASAP